MKYFNNLKEVYDDLKENYHLINLFRSRKNNFINGKRLSTLSF